MGERDERVLEVGVPEVGMGETPEGQECSSARMLSASARLSATV